MLYLAQHLAGLAAGQAFLFNKSLSHLSIGLRVGVSTDCDTGPGRLAGLEEAEIGPAAQGGLEASADGLPRPARPADGGAGVPASRALSLLSGQPPSIPPSCEVGIQPMAGGVEVRTHRGQLIPPGRHQLSWSPWRGGCTVNE